MMKQGDKGKMFARQCGVEFIRLSWDKPSPTILKNFRLSGAMGLVHPEINKHIGIQEAKRIASYPDNYNFIGSIANQWGRIGNSVPPRMMQAIAEHIKVNILDKAHG